MNQHTDCHRTLKKVNLLFYSGFGLLVLTWVVREITEELFTPPVILGVVFMIAGLILASRRLRCPYCGDSLCLGGRLPIRLPDYCPHCGKPL